MYGMEEEEQEYLRCQVAQRLGWRSVEYNREGFLIGHAPGRRDFQAVPSFARDLGAAWSLVDFLIDFGIITQVQTDKEGEKKKFKVDMTQRGNRLSFAESPTASLAICRAFLKILPECLTCPKKTFVLVLAAGLLSFVSPAHAIPTGITYQGTLKSQGLPANGTQAMSFRITNQDGTQVYWSSGEMSVTTSNGLFAAHLNPTGVDWQNVTPYIEVSIGGQILLPRDPIESTIYTTMSEGVVDGAITTPKLATGAVTTAQLADGAVTTAKLATGAVTTVQLASQSVTTDGLMDNAITTPKIADGSVTASKLDPAVQTTFIPAGMIVAFGGSTPPSGWLVCDGKAYAPHQYASLFAAIGTTWGGDGVSTFNVPNLSGRTAIGAGLSAPGNTNWTIGESTGEEKHTLTIDEMPSHSHKIDDPGHTHGLYFGTPGGGDNNYGETFYPGNDNVQTVKAFTGITIQPAGGSQPHNIMQPSAVVNYIIKY